MVASMTDASREPGALKPDDDAVVTGSWGHGRSRWSIVVHGGAGDVAAAKRPLCVAGCERAAAAGAAILAAGGSALDAVQRAVEILEDDPLFNAGTGSCLNADATVELDASIMDGSSLRAGGVCALPPFANPIAIARRVMEASPHVLLAGEGAARFATEQGFARVDASTLITEEARKRWTLVRVAREPKAKAPSKSGGTVGAAAKDEHGHVAAATSTGGMVNKLAGRVGDSPVPGAGTYADDLAGACSTTGHGEAMMRVCLAKSVIDGLVGTAPSLPEQAARDSLAMMFRRTHEKGGAIVASSDGSLGVARTTTAMSWAAVTESGTASGT
jgi:beta-aspartyl-peptidase (threonine type)